MATEIHLDLLGGLAGDMFVAAMLDLLPELEPRVSASLASLDCLAGVTARLVRHNDGILSGRRFLVEKYRRTEPHTHRHHGHAHHAGHDHHPDHDHDDGHDHDHGHVAWAEIRSALEGAALGEAVRRHAIGIFTELAEAEARVHGVAPADVAFHEVGAWDSIADIVAAAEIIAAVDAKRWTVGPIPLGSGRVRTAHGPLPVPAPATVLLLEGFTTIDDGVAGERVTPTGAAILRHLCGASTRSQAPRRLAGTGIGFGTRVLPGMSNCVRALRFEPSEAVAGGDRVAVIEFEIDDQSGEDLALGLDRLRAHADVIDVIQSPAFGKKGRMIAAVRLLARPEARDDVIRLCFDETTTIGLRHAIVERAVLPRRAGSVSVDGRQVRVKAVERPGGTTAKAEADDLAAVGGQAQRQALRRAVEQAAGEEAT